MHRKWSLAIAGVILILAGAVLAYLTQTSGGIQIRDVRFAGAKGNTMSALLYIPPNATAQDPRPRHSGRARLHQFARDPGWLRHRICPQGLRGAGARPDRPRLQRSAGLRQRLWRPRWARASAQPRHRRQEQYRARGPFDGRLDRARRRDRDAQRLQVDGAGGILDRQTVRRRGHARAGRATSRWCSRNTRSFRS